MKYFCSFASCDKYGEKICILESFVPAWFAHIEPTSTGVEIGGYLFSADITLSFAFTLNPLQPYNHNIIFSLCIFLLFLNISIKFTKLHKM